MKYADNDIQRFVDAQSGGAYDRALAEICAGRKRGHWIGMCSLKLAGWE